MCCAIGAMFVAMIAIWRRRMNAAPAWHRLLRWGAALAAALVVGAGTAAAAQHLRHYAERAGINRRTVLAEMWAQPFCEGGAALRAGEQRMSTLD